MPRKGPAPKRPIIIDPVYASPLVFSRTPSSAP